MVEDSGTEYTLADYKVEVTRGEEGEFFAAVPRLPGCFAEGKTIADVYENIEMAFEDWVEDMLGSGQEVPSPIAADNHSGKFIVRTKPELHADLVAIAASNGVSLNAYVVSRLAEAAGEARAETELASRFAVIERQMTVLTRQIADVRLDVGVFVDSVSCREG